MSKEYYRWEQSKMLGVISSPQCPVLQINDRSGKNMAVTACLNSVIFWNIRTACMSLCLSTPDSDAMVTSMLYVDDPIHRAIIFVGYSDGAVRIWRLDDPMFCAESASTTFSGHRSAVCELSFASSKAHLASASRDGNIVVWDLVGENGICRLEGHSQAITGLHFSARDPSVLISCSRDALIKIWDLNTVYCVETVVCHSAEITAMCYVDRIMDDALERLVTCGADDSLRLFSLDPVRIHAKIESISGKTFEQMDSSNEKADSVADVNGMVLLETVKRSSSEKIVHAAVDEQGKYVACTSASGACELWRLRSYSEHESLKQINVKKAAKRALKSGKTSLADSEVADEVSTAWFKAVRFFRLPSGKVRSLYFTPSSLWKISQHEAVSFLVGYADNRILTISVPVDPTMDVEITCALDHQGHRGECKTVSTGRVSANGIVFATASKDLVKVWNAESGALLRTVELADVSAMIFVSKDTQLLVADEQGYLHVVDLATGDLVGSIKAHEGSIRSIATLGSQFATGGMDKCVKLWECHTKEESLTMKHIQTLDLGDEVLVIRFSPDAQYLAVATLDMTIKIFTLPNLRFFLSLYGHRLPVTALEITPDSKSLLSASADKNFKLWSLQFGDCRRSVFAHEESLTSLTLIPHTFLFATASLDGSLKLWDLQNLTSYPLQRIIRAGPILALAATSCGTGLITASRDRAIRVFRLGEEQIFPEEEEDRQVEEQIEASILKDQQEESVPQTLASMKAGERIMEAIEAADDQRRRYDEWIETGRVGNEPVPSTLFMALQFSRDSKSPAQLLLNVI